MGAESEPSFRWSPLTVSPEATPRLDGVVETVRHPEFAGMTFLHVRARTLLNAVPAASRMPFRWTANLYRGCSHACGYCFARPSHTWLELDPDEGFDTTIVVKINAVERLRAELRANRTRGEAVALGTNTDPYQRCEGRYRLTRGVLETFVAAHHPFSLLTKGTLVTRDADVLAAATRDGICRGVALSIGTADAEVARLTESGAPRPDARLAAVAALTDAGVDTGVMLAPIIPGLSDSDAQLTATVRAALDAGATSVRPIVLHLRPGVREIFLRRLGTSRPDVADCLAAMYTSAVAPREVRRRISARVREIVAECGGPRPSSLPAPTRGNPPPPRAGGDEQPGEQLSLC
ncbi:MAG: radical SAM protein [Nitriliruptoraceae bacterium]